MCVWLWAPAGGDIALLTDEVLTNGKRDIFLCNCFAHVAPLQPMFLGVYAESPLYNLGERKYRYIFLKFPLFSLVEFYITDI